MKTEQILMAMTILAMAVLGRFRFVGYDGGVCVAGARPLGVSNDDYGIGARAGVVTHGIVIVSSGGAISVGAEIEVGTGGVAITKTTGITAGYALDAAGASGELIRVKLS
jgi:Uncharacterized conserved protein (DUF2190)